MSVLTAGLERAIFVPHKKQIEMSITELKKIVDETSGEERVFLAAYLRHVERRHDPAHRETLDRLCEEARSGRRYSLSRARELHDKLEAGDR